MSKSILSVDRTEIPKHELDVVTLWASHENVTHARKLISDEIAALMTENVNLKFQTVDYPNYAQTVEENDRCVSRLRIFLEVLDELRERKYTKRTTITTKSL